MTTHFKTAYEEALATADSEEDTTSFSSANASSFLMPSYMVAADTHNIANNNQTFLESAAETVESIPKFIGLSLLSGANQIYNIPTDIGNIFGADFERSEIDDFVADIDGDLAKYYGEHREGIDTLGFVASSLFPGLGGIKALHAGQTVLKTALNAGKFGPGMSKALGLLVPQKQKFIGAAIKEAINSNSVVSLTQRNTLLAIGAGFGQNFMEAAAFETAIAATLFNSPVLENQELGDLVSNIFWGGLVFGSIGGTIDATRSYFSIKKAVKVADAEAMPWKFIEELPTKAQTYEKLAYDFEQMHTIPEVPKSVDEARANFLKSAAEEKISTLNLRVRKNLAELANKDQDLAETLFQLTKPTSLTDKLGTFVGLKSTSRLADTSAAEREVSQLARKVKGKRATAGEIEKYANSHIAYVKLWGEGAGKVTTTKPVITSISDLLKKGQKVEVNTKEVVAGKQKFKFEFKQDGKGKPWDVLKASPMEAQARYIWSLKLPEFNPGKSIVIPENDIPLLEKAYREYNTNQLQIKVHLNDGFLTDFASGKDLLKFIENKKISTANKLHEFSVTGKTSSDSEAVIAKLQAILDSPTVPESTKAATLKMKAIYEKRARQLSQDEIASIVNVKSSYLSGEQSVNSIEDIFALQKASEDYTRKLINAGARKESDGLVDIWNVPQHSTFVYDSSPFAKLSGHEIENMAIIKEKQKLYIDSTNRATASILGAEYNNLPEITAQLIQSSANRIGAGAGFATAASSNYGSLAAFTEHIGKVTSRIIDTKQTATRDLLEPILYKLGQNQEAAIEWAQLNNTLRSIPDHYVLDLEKSVLVPKALSDWEAAAAKAQALGKTVPDRPILNALDAPLEIPIKNKEVLDLAEAHIGINGKRVDAYRTLRTAQGLEYKTSSDIFYPPPINPKDYPFFAIVTDESITGTGHAKTVFAASEKELESMVAKLKTEPNLKVRLKTEAEDYYKAIGKYDFEKVLNDNYLDVAMHRKGVSSSYFTPTEPDKIVSDILSWHMEKEAGLVRETISTKYEVPFEELRRLGDSFTKVATSQFSNLSLVKYADTVINNPFIDYIRTSLAIRNYSDYPWWVSMNRLVDEKVSQMYSRISGAFENARSPDDLTKVNKILQEYGYKGAAYDEAMDIFANHSAPKGVLTSFINKANSLLATIVLRLDTLNAVNNAVSANVLLGAESRAVIKAIERGDEDAVGSLAQIAKIQVPGTDKLILSPSRLIANAMRKFGANTPEMKFYKDNGFTTTISEQYRQSLDALSVSGKETVKELNGKIQKVFTNLREAANKGEKWTGNRLAEEFNRFVAADVMKQISDIAVAKGYITAKEQLSYINTFVNRTQGNYFAAQRPMMFQGPVGQAIGLFQTYQFNLMQQLLRHVGEGQAKDAMTLLALQGTIHGMNGLPAFNAINTHIIGNASGNSNHRDLYDTVYGAAGKQAGNWLMYGIGSNWLLHPDLKVNLYIRGDINPRHVTIVPTDPSSVPIVQASGRFFSNLFDTAGKIAAGGDVVTTLLQGLEHNGISRPLAGLAQTLEGLANPIGRSYSTSSRGNVISSNDVLSLANLGRLVGGKPLDEAIALDAAFRFKAYGLVDARKRQELGEAIKSTVIAGKQPSTEQIESFIDQYVKLGGKQENFNKWFLQLYKTANLSQSNKIQNDLNNKFSQSMQKIMGGAELRDFIE